MQDILSILNKQRFEILKGLVKGRGSATVLAKKLQLSIAHVSSQLHLLEAFGLVRKKQRVKGKVGKPRTEYEIAKTINLLYCISPYTVSYKNLSSEAHFLCNVGSEASYYLHKFYFLYEELVGKTQGIGLLNTDNKEIHLLIIADGVEEIRKDYSNVVIANLKGNKRKIIIWSHTFEEIREGLEKKETYFVDKVKQVTPLWEHDVGVFGQVKEHA